MIPTTTSPTTAGRPVALVQMAGWLCFAGGLIGAAQAVVVMTWPAAVDSTRYSYPFDPTGFVIAQITFFAQHLLLVAGLWGLRRMPAIRATRAGRVGADAAIAGMAILAIIELVATSAAQVAEDSTRAGLVNGSYTVPVLVIAAGAIAAGVGARRSIVRAEPAWLPALLIAIGVYAVVPMSPALAGPFLLGRLAIGGWMLLFAALGWGMTRPTVVGTGREHTPRATHGGGA